MHPNKLLGVIADHGDFPIERLGICRSGRWLGSASHDEVLKLTDISDLLVGSDEEKEKEEQEGEVMQGAQGGESESGSDSDSDSDEGEKADEAGEHSSDEEVPVDKKRKKKTGKDPLGIKKKRVQGHLQPPANTSFFSDL